MNTITLNETKCTYGAAIFVASALFNGQNVKQTVGAESAILEAEDYDNMTLEELIEEFRDEFEEFIICTPETITLTSI